MANITRFDPFSELTRFDPFGDEFWSIPWARALWKGFPRSRRSSSM